ncbi:MAG TPA: hypothetical protein VFQ91_12685 [Bryobacteraceae bacterium]|nr:hypothetical protein [Bryobacteraceae bacterium]
MIYETSWYGPMLTGLSHLFWPTALLIGGWVGQWDPLTYWFRVAAAILANAVVYAGGFAAGRAVLRLPANR